MEKRTESLKRASFPFRYRLEEGENVSTLRHGSVVDHNARGMRFEAPEKLPVGTRLRLNFDEVSPVEGEFPLGAEGVVVWSIQPNPNVSVYRVGLKYL